MESISDMITYEDFSVWPGHNLINQFQRMVELFPQRPAIIQGGKQLTYAEFDQITDQLSKTILQSSLEMVILCIDSVCRSGLSRFIVWI